MDSTVSSNKMLTRDKTIDVAKGIGIFLVVFAHLNCMMPMHTIIYSFHIPLFFFISGLLFQKEKFASFKDFLKRRMITIGCPYLLFGILSVLYSFGICFIQGDLSSETFTTFCKNLFEVFYSRHSGAMHFNTPLWFVPCLFLTECIYYWVSEIKQKWLFYCSVVLIVFFGWFSESALCPIDFSVLPWNFSSACFALGFYAVGNLSHPAIVKLNSSRCTLKAILVKAFVALCCFAALIPLAIKNQTVSIGSRYLGNGFIFYATGLLGSLGVFLVANLLQNLSLLRFWGKNSFYIMATHKPIQGLIFAFSKHILSRNLDNSIFELVPSLVIIVLTLTVSTLFILLYKKLLKQIKRRENGRTA